MLLRALLTSPTPPKFYTKAESYLGKNLDDFILMYTMWRNQNPSDVKLKEFNTLLEVMHNNKLIVLGDTPYSNGVLNITDIGENGVLHVSDHTMSILKRTGKTIPHVIDLSERVEGLEIIYGSSTPFDTYVALKYVKKQLQCIERGIPFELTLTDMKRLLKTKRCYYSGVELTLEGDHRLSLDRISPSLPYTKENTVACAANVNSIKNKLIECKQETKYMSDKEIKAMLLSFTQLL